MTLNPKEQISRVATSDDNLKNNISDKNSLNVIQKSSKFPANVPGPEYKMELKWTNIIIISILHVLFIVNFFVDKKWQTLVFGIFQGLLSGIGITVAAHRLFSHNSFKVNTALKLLLLYFQTLSFQNSAYDWARDHRLHHKYTDTNADPHNIRRGFFFSHVGWLLCKKHPDIKKYAKKISMADLEADKLVMFQHRHFTIIKLVVAALIPALIPCYFWNESFLASFLFVNIFRYIVTLHMTWMINSAAHTYGMRPFDKSISPTDSYYVGIVTIGEGWHNYHHVFPYGYNSSDFGSHFFNITAGFIDFFAWIGWAYDLKTVSLDIIRKRAVRAGDGSYNPFEDPELLKKSDDELLKEIILKKSIDDNGNVILNDKEQIWGEEDEAMSEEERKYIKILRKHEN